MAEAADANGQENILAIHAAELAVEPNFKSCDDIVDHCCYAWNSASISGGKSCPSRAAIGQPQVTQSEDWFFT